MKKFKKQYISFMEKIQLNDTDIMKIKQNVYEHSNKKQIKLKPVYIAIILLFVCSTISVTANVLISNFKIPINEPTKKVILTDSSLNKNYNSSLLKENNYYQLSNIEKTLNLKILRNSKILNDLFELTNSDVIDNKISKLNFWLVNNDKSQMNASQINFAFEINTNYSNEDSKLALVGNSKMEYYYIENLDTQAVIIESSNEKSGPLLSNFVYEGIVYSLDLEKTFFTKKDLYSILDSFYI